MDAGSSNSDIYPSHSLVTACNYVDNMNEFAEKRQDVLVSDLDILKVSTPRDAMTEETCKQFYDLDSKKTIKLNGNTEVDQVCPKLDAINEDSPKGSDECILDRAKESSVKEILNTCRWVSCSPDPLRWTCSDVKFWFIWQCQKYKVPEPDLAHFNMSGEELCKLKREYFEKFAPEAAEILCSSLEIWRNVVEITLEKYVPLPLIAITSLPVPKMDLAKTSISTNSTTSLGTGVFSKPMPSNCECATRSVSPTTSSGCTSPTFSASLTFDCSRPSRSFNRTTSMDSGSTTRTSSPSSYGFGRTSVGLCSDESSYSTSVSLRSPDIEPVVASSVFEFCEGDQHSGQHKRKIPLWRFLLLLLRDEKHVDCIRWIDEPRRIFKIDDSKKVAKLWGARKNVPSMNYDKLSRSIRQYYKKNIIRKTDKPQRLVYQFCKAGV